MMSRSFLLLLGLILVSGLVSGSEAKHEDKSLKKKEKKRRTASEGSFNARYSDSDYRHSLSEKDYTEDTLRKIGFAIGEQEARGIRSADYRHQDSSDSLNELVNEPGSPALNVVGRLDRDPNRIVFGYRSDPTEPPQNVRANFSPDFFSRHAEETDGDASQRQRRNSEVGTSSTKSNKSDSSKSSKKKSSSHK